MAAINTITIIKDGITDGEIDRCILAHKAGVSPMLIAFDAANNALTFERCTPINKLSDYYYDIYDLLLRAIRYDRQLSHCDPGPKCTSEKGCNVMLLNGKPALIDWGEVCPSNLPSSSDEVLALDVFMKYWFKPATEYKIIGEGRVLEKLQEMKEYIKIKYGTTIGRTPYESFLKNNIILKKNTISEQDARLKAKLARYSKNASGVIGSSSGTKHKGTKHKGTKHKGTKHKGTKHKGTKHKGTKHKGTKRKL